MTALSPAFQDHLDTGTTTLAWAWRITRSDGAVYGFTDHDADLTFDGTTFESETGLIASEIRQSADLAVDAQDAEGILTSDRINETDISDGLWDNADVEVWRVNWSNPAERALRRRGSIGQIRRGRVSFVAEVRSLTHILGQTVGRNFQGTCDAELGDARCGINLELSIYKGTGEVATIRDDRTFTATGLGSYSTGWFSSGFVEWTSGANAGRRAEVAVHTNDAGGVAVVLLDLPVRPVALGDDFLIRAGCDKQIATCAAKFANVPNFRGFPTIPGQETVLRYASAAGSNDGETL
ncbi:minor tail protein [Rhodobacter phage RcKemmy]|nr:minor tail protein [Rhodobacter phage RcKemmy]